jgi:hypothetical protein
MRRNAEDLDNDFGVAFDAAERFRRIRALRSRLAVALRRDPTDAEIIAASVDPAYAARSPFAGRGGGDGPPGAGKALTQDQLDQEREFRTRVGRTGRLDETADDAPNLVETARPLESGGDGDAARPVIEGAAADAVSRLMQETLDLMGLPPVQREIVSRRYGLPPHPKESSARDISRDLNVHRDRVGRVLEAFGSEMSRPGGAFHRACDRFSDADLADIGLDWVRRTLRAEDIPADQPPLPEALTAEMTTRRRRLPPPPSITSGKGTFAQFLCEFHGRGFVGVYASVGEVPTHRECPACGRPSPAVRLMDA